MTMDSGNLLEGLYSLGLGELLMLYVTHDKVLLGNLVIEKGKLAIKDRGHLKNVRPAQVAACLDAGIMGALCSLEGCEWQSLTFLGVEHCHVPTGDLSETRTGLLMVTKNQYGDSLMDFKGSVYRGFQLMIDNHFLPIVLCRSLETTQGVPGLAVCDLRLASIPLATVQKVNQAVRASVDRYLTLDVQDLDMGDEEFSQLFGAYLKDE